MRHDDDGQTVSIWMATSDVPVFAPLEDDLDADVVVVGAGIAGLTTAYLLAGDGRRVVVLDDGSIGGGQTKRTTAHLASAMDDGFARLEHLHGAEGARFAWQSHAAAIDQIDAIVRAENIACGFERLDGFLCRGEGEDEASIQDEFDAAQRAGYATVELLEHAPIAGLEGPCLRFPDQAQFHPLRYLAGLARAAVARDVRIFTGSHVEAIDPSKQHPWRFAVRTEAGATVSANWVVVATNSPIHTRIAMHTKQHAYRTYAIALSAPRGTVARGLYWDTLDPYHYVRVHAEPGDAEEFVIVGGEDHRIGATTFEEADDRYAQLEEWARARFPGLGTRASEWSGQVMEPVDGLAFIGHSPGGPEGVLLATGDSGMGLTHGTIAGLLLTDLVAGRESPWARLYDPSRKSLRAAGEFARENAVSVAHYLEWLKPTPDAEEIERGTGAVVRRGTRMLAVYREDDGQLTACTAVCPHLGGIVGWNASEKTWDCPCHGSRFDRYGRVVQGPANSDLEAAELEAGEMEPGTDEPRGAGIAVET